MITGRVRGQAELRRVQGLITTSPEQMQKHIAAGVRVAVKQIQPGVKTEALLRLPKRGGYAAVMAAAAKAQTSVRVSGNTINASATVSARGKQEDRDVARVNRGQLRHPLFRNRLSWHTTRVRPGFVTVVINKTRDQIVDIAKDARDRAALSIVRG